VRSLRLLPIVIYASVALLLFKGIGLITDGAYVLVGAPPATAATEAPESTAAEALGPAEVTLEDTSPTLDDSAPTLSTKPDSAEEAGHGTGDVSQSSETPHGASSEAAVPASSEASSQAAPAESSASAAVASGVACPEASEAALPSSEPLPPDAGPIEDTETAAAVDCASTPPVPTDEHGDAVATTMDAEGNIVPLSQVDGGSNEDQLLARLSERRAALDKFAADLDVRAALVEAAEQRLNERTAALKDLEAQIAALVDQKEAEQDAQFKAVVSMYETMKPREAAKIFDALETRTLLRVARAMNPRKMAPILAAMSALRAQELTTAMAADTPPPKVAAAGEDLANLPQIVGK
jgi:flagellar motility protein MotE (MotC chaperone)